MTRLIALAVAALLAIGGCSDTGATTPAALSDSGTSAAPTETSAPTATPTSFKPIAASGRGSKVLKFTIPEAVPAIATISAKGSDNFVVTSLAKDGSENDLLVNVIGNYAGTVLFDAQAGEHSVAFKIESGGTWTATIKPVTAARTWTGTSKLTGKADDVVQINPASSGLVTLNITHSGAENFVVTGYSDSGSDLMVNEIGKYDGQVPLADGSFLFTVGADGAWTVVPGS